MSRLNNPNTATTGIGFSSSEPGKWCLVKHGEATPWVSITLEGLEGDIKTKSVLTNDMQIVKEILQKPDEMGKIKSLQAVFACDFPDNQGIGVSDIYKLTECMTKKGATFHSFLTRYGVCRIGGPIKLMASEVQHGKEVVLYSAQRPKERYYGG